MPEIHLKRLGRAGVYIPITGTAPLIQNRFSEKAKGMMLDGQQGKVTEREPKDPEALSEAALYRLPPDRYGHPSVGFKKATVGGLRFFKGSKLSMTAAQAMIFVVGEGSDSLVEIEGSEPKQREDAVRISGKTADLRYRPGFWPWQATLHIVYVKNQFSVESLVALVDAGGNIGVGEWRPEFGTYRVDDSREVVEERAP